MDPCEKTRQDKTAILTAYCASCHSGAAAVGLPPWNFVLDDQRLVSSVWMREGQPAQRFLIPGDPDHSALYQRMAVVQDMPPQPTDLGTHQNSRPTAADNSIVREWILHCLAGASGTASGGSDGTGGLGSGGIGGGAGGAGDATSGGASGAESGSGGSSSDGGSSSSGGSSGGGASGTGSGGEGGQGSGGTASGATGGSGNPGSTNDAGTADGRTGTGGTPSDGGAGDRVVKVCAYGVTSGGSCSSSTPDCELGSKTCTCHLASGKHTWSCR